MRQRFVLPLYLVLFTSTMTAAVEPIGSLGEGVLQQVHFLPDGTVLRVRADHIEIVNPDTNVIVEKFAEGLNWGKVTLSPDGARLAITTDLGGTTKPFIEIWEIAKRKLIRRLEPIFDGVSLVAFSSAAPLLAVTYRDQIHLWNWDNNEYLGEMTGERRPSNNCYSYSDDWGSGSHCSGPAGVLSLAFSPDGNFLTVGSQRQDAEIWDVSTRKLVGHLEGHVDWVTYVSYSPDGRYIATARPDSTRVYLWDAQTRQLIRDWLTGGSRGSVPKLLFSSDSERLYVATRTYDVPTNRNLRNDRVRVWDVQTGVQLNEFGDELFTLEDFSLLPDEEKVLLRYERVGVVLWDIEHNRRLALWADYLSGYDWELSPDGRSLVTVNSVVMKIWDVPSRSLRKIIVPQNRWFRRFAISPDSQTIAIGQDPWIELRDIHTGEVTAQFDYHSGQTAIAFNQTGKRIAAEHLILDINDPKNREVLDDLGYVFIIFSARDAYLASTDGDHIHLWKQQEDKYVLRHTWYWPTGSGWRSTLAFLSSPDESPVLAAGSFEQVNVWRIREELEQALTLDAMGPVHFSENGQYLFCNGENGLQIWDWREKKQIQHLPIPQYFAVSRDGSVFLTLDDETGQVLIWDGRSLLPPEPAVSYDINRDGRVNILDLVQAASQFGQIGANLTGDVNRDGRVDVSDLGHIGSRLGENAAAPALSIDDSNPLVSYHSSAVKRQFQALTALESLETPSHGAHIARDLLKAWLFHMMPSVRSTKLLPNYPNPFNPETWIPYQLAEAAHVQIRIYDVAGQLVRTLDLGTKLAGSYLSREQAAYWDGRNDGGEKVSSGIYWYKLDTGSFKVTRKMVIQK